MLRRTIGITRYYYQTETSVVFKKVFCFERANGFIELKQELYLNLK
jgi:hypothetical protein